MFPEFGLTINSFFDSLSDTEIRKFFDTSVLSVLDALAHGKVEGLELKRIATTYVDLDATLNDTDGRRLVLSLIPVQKRGELEARVDRSIEPNQANSWTNPEITRLRDFFGLMDEQLSLRTSIGVDSVEPVYGLFQHQRGAVEELLPLLTDGDQRAVLHLPTGVGKTRTAMHVVASFLRNNEPSVVVWLASGKELLEQAGAAFQEAWSNLGTRSVKFGVLQGQQTLALEEFDDGFICVSLAKAWSMLTGSHPDWTLRIAKKTRLVVFDEAHQSIARTFRRITEELTTDYRCALLGLTATPGRTWDDIDEDGRLAAFFDHNKVTLNVPAENPIEYLISNGYLARPTFRTLLASPGLKVNESDLARIKSSLDIPTDVLARLSMSDQYVAVVLDAIEDFLEAKHKRILVFAASVELSRLLTAVLNMRGVEAYSVTGGTSIQARSSAIRAFKSDLTQPIVLVNYGVLTTGFDAPRASAGVIARPTKSLVLYSQMIGRLIRGPKADGTETCEVVTVVDTRLPGFGDIAEAFSNWEDIW